MRRGALRIALACALLGSVAHADDAADLKRRGDEAMEGGRAAEALDAYRRAQAMTPSPALDYNIGRALLAIGDFVAALEHFERFEQKAPEDLKARTHRLAEVIAELRAKIATLSFVGGPTGARVIVRGEDVGALPHAPLQANPGPVEIRVEADGHQPFVARFDLAPGESRSVQVALTRLRATGRLEVASRPASATLAIDGVVRGTTPVTLELPAGRHVLLATAPRHEPRRTTVDVTRGASARVWLDLDEAKEAAPSLASRWWFWGAIGAVVAGAAAVIVVSTTERGADDGTLGTFHVP